MQILKLMPLLIADVKSVGKDHTNTFQKYKFRAVDDLMAALNPVLAKHGVTLVPRFISLVETPTEKGVRVRVTLDTDWVAPDGSKVTTTHLGEGIDNGDKAVYKAMAGAMKYCILQTLQVPTGDKADPEFDNR